MLLGLLGQRLQELGVNLQGAHDETELTTKEANEKAMQYNQLSDLDKTDLVGDPELVREAGGVSAHLDNENKIMIIV